MASGALATENSHVGEVTEDCVVTLQIGNMLMLWFQRLRRLTTRLRTN